MAICKLCHRVKHLGHTQILAQQGIIGLDRVVHHYMKVNHVGRAQFETDADQAFALWEIRSKYDWTTNFGKWTSLVKTRSKRKYRNGPSAIPSATNPRSSKNLPVTDEPEQDVLW